MTIDFNCTVHVDERDNNKDAYIEMMEKLKIIEENEHLNEARRFEAKCCRIFLSF